MRGEFLLTDRLTNPCGTPRRPRVGNHLLQYFYFYFYFCPSFRTKDLDEALVAVVAIQKVTRGARREDG